MWDAVRVQKCDVAIRREGKFCGAGEIIPELGYNSASPATSKT